MVPVLFIPPTAVVCPRLVPTSVGRRDGMGEGVCRRRRVVVGCFDCADGTDGTDETAGTDASRSLGIAEGTGVVLRALVPFARRGILFGDCPFVLAAAALVVLGVGLVTGALLRTGACERNVRVGRCSDAVTRVPLARVVADLGFALRAAVGIGRSAGRTSLSSSRSESVSEATRFPAGVLRG